ncbi:glycosyltransferase [Teichococcus wenyumeiae]|uniref:glycosyltransferase n=1 Tax=Teichococcus wenyumeiae TaxID=2478470 RepID=UPI0018F55D98|nr:glycosyltransferase [Pseudoroseomonas wenyumeiae]
MHQRPQHLLTYAAGSHRVYFFEEPIFEDGLTEPRLDLQIQPCGVVVAVPTLPSGYGEAEAVEAQRGFLDAILESHPNSRTTFWYYSPMALRFSAHQVPDLCVYDCMDELSAFRGAPPELTNLESQLFDLADLVFTGGHSLYEAKKTRHANVHAFPSSIDKAHFSRARQGGMEDPADQKHIPHPRIGFFGVVDERMDIRLVANLADLRPDWNLVMIGPVVKIDPALLPRRPNIHWLGMKSYQDLPRYLAGWDAGFMPFALNEATRFISPTKTPEFLSAGLPVVSTPVRDVQRPYGSMGLVSIAADAVEMARMLEAVMAGPREEWQAMVDHYLADMSWQGTWAAMDRLMRQHSRHVSAVGQAPRRGTAAHV